MCQIKNTHRPSTPMTANLPVCSPGNREEITKRKALDKLAVGAQRAGTPNGGQWRSHTTKTTERGTHGKKTVTRPTRSCFQTGIARHGTPADAPGDTGMRHTVTHCGDATSPSVVRTSSAYSEIRLGESLCTGQTGELARVRRRRNGAVERAVERLRPANKRAERVSFIAPQNLVNSDHSCAHSEGEPSGWGVLSKYISNSSCYRIGSCLRRCGGGLSQFGPVFLPVGGAHFLAGDGTTRKKLNGFAVQGRNGLLSLRPVRHHGRGNAQGLRNGKRPTTLPIHPVFKVHLRIISHGVSICQ